MSGQAPPRVGMILGNDFVVDAVGVADPSAAEVKPTWRCIAHVGFFFPPKKVGGYGLPWAPNGMPSKATKRSACTENIAQKALMRELAALELAI